MEELYRAMKQAGDGLPRIEASARGLGVRPNTDLPVDESGEVRPGTGGMSVCPGSPWYVPPHRRPRRLGRGSTGHDGDAVYVLSDSALDERELILRLDPGRPMQHAFVEPRGRVTLESYEDELARTRPDWRNSEP